MTTADDGSQMSVGDTAIQPSGPFPNRRHFCNVAVFTRSMRATMRAGMRSFDIEILHVANARKWEVTECSMCRELRERRNYRKFGHLRGHRLSDSACLRRAARARKLSAT